MDLEVRRAGALKPSPNTPGAFGRVATFIENLKKIMKSMEINGFGGSARRGLEARPQHAGPGDGRPNSFKTRKERHENI